MEFSQYLQKTQQAAQLVISGQLEQATDIYRELLQSDISDRDKAMMCYNLAFIAGKQSRNDEVLSWYDAGIRYEQPHSQFFVMETKAAYLANRGDVEECLLVYRYLYEQPFLQEEDKERIRRNIENLERKHNVEE
jgi:tetratricopeptide (TPR) repeat protein